MSTVSKSRIRIFDYWQIQEPSLESQPAVRRSGEPAFGEDLISEAQRLISNVNEFLESRRAYQQKIITLRSQIEDLLATLYDACNSEAQEQTKAEASLKIYRANLRKLYICLREGRLLHNAITSYFQLANLANYDRTLTQLSFTEPEEVMEERLEGAVRALQRAMHLLIEAQKLLESGKELSSLFGKEQSPVFCRQRLEELLTHDNLVRIHFLMIYQLEQLQVTVENLAEFLRVSEAEYLKYELVLDCVFLMRVETQEMQEQLTEAEQELEFACSHPAEVEVRAIAASYHTRTEAWQQNTQIYQANLENFTRVNVETNMFYYSELKARFVEQFERFTQGIDRQDTNHTSLLFLLDRQALLSDIQRRVALTKKIAEPDRRLALSIYNQCSDHATPSECAPLAALKESLLAEMEVLLVNNGIAYNKRARERVTLEQDILRHQSIVQAIEAAPPHEQYALITDSLSSINASSFELEGFMADRTKMLSRRSGESEESFRNKMRAINSYRLALLYAAVIGKQEDLALKLEEFESIRAKEGFEDLPLRFQATLFNYINDIRIIEDSRQLSQQLQKVLEKISERFKESLTKSRLRGNADPQLEKELEELRDLWLQLYHGYFRRISACGEELWMQRLLEVCNQIAQMVRSWFPEDSHLVDRRTMDINRKAFFSHRILNELLALSANPPSRDSFKIINIPETLEEVFRQLDNDFISKPTGGKINETVKLALLEQYFSRTFGKSSLSTAMRTLRRISYLQTVSELYPASSLPSQQLLQALLRLQLLLNAPPLPMRSDEHRSLLAQRIPFLLKEMRKFPLTLAAKHDVSGFQAIWRHSQIIQELKAALKPPLQMINVACMYVGICELKDARKAGEGNYDAYENVVVKERKSIEEYFGAAAVAYRPRIESISREIELATKSFFNRDESVSLSRAIEALCKKAQ